MESFLKEQLKRIRELTEKVASWEQRAAEINREIDREREHSNRGPLQEVRDLRPYRADHSGRSHADDRPVRRSSKRRRRHD